MLYNDIFYMTLNEKKCYDVQGLPAHDPVRLYVEENTYPVSYEMLDGERDEIRNDYQYDFPYEYITDIDDREDVLNQRWELRVDDEEYKEIVAEMKGRYVYEQYTRKR